MAFKDSNDEELMLRLSNHVTGISLILDIVDVNSFPRGSRLQQVIAQQLIELRGRINHIPAATNATPKNGVPAVPASKKPKKTAPKPPVKVASPVPAVTHPSLQEQGWRILQKERETANFEHDVHNYNHYFCILCVCTVHPKNLIQHIRGRTHQSQFVEEESNDGNSDGVDWMREEMENCDNDRRIELMWDIVYATDNTIDNIELDGKWFYCRLCEKTLNGPFPVVDHVRGSAHHAE